MSDTDRVAAAREAMYDQIHNNGLNTMTDTGNGPTDVVKSRKLGSNAFTDEGTFQATARLNDQTPRTVTVPGSYQSAAAALTYGFLVFPQVPPKKIWMVMRVGVTAPDPFTTLAGVTVLAFRSSNMPQDSNTEPVTFGDLVGVLGSVPNTLYPAYKSTFLRGNERLNLAFKSLANLQQIQASMDVIEYDLMFFFQNVLNT